VGMASTNLPRRVMVARLFRMEGMLHSCRKWTHSSLSVTNKADLPPKLILTYPYQCLYYACLSPQSAFLPKCPFPPFTCEFLGERDWVKFLSESLVPRLVHIC
jgi:hypothetical protein